MFKRLLEKLLAHTNKSEGGSNSKKVKRSPGRSLHGIMWERAAEQSADFVEEHLADCLIFKNKPEMWSYVARLLNESSRNGICLEFGVAGGSSINFLSKSLPNFRFFGFDSFLGLKEDWKGHHAAKGSYSRNGVLPRVNSNVELIPGWFDETVPVFLQQHGGDMSDLRLVHIDSDTYEAAVVIFDEIGKSLKPGVFVLFDELIGYPNWVNGEFKALREAERKFRFKYKYRAFSSEQALIEILDPD